MRMILRGAILFFMAWALGACAGPQSGWQESYAGAPGYYAPNSNYDYRDERERACPPRRDRYELYEEEGRNDYPYAR